VFQRLKTKILLFEVCTAVYCYSTYYRR